MKKQLKFVVAALTLMLMSFTTKAQFNKKDKFVEGTVSYTNSTNVKGAFAINPTVGYFLTDRFAAGLIGKFGKSTSQTTIGAGIFGRCYVLNIGSKCKVYSQLTLSNTSVKTNGTVSTTNVNAGIGLNHFVTKKLALSADLASLIDYTYTPAASSFSIGFNGVNNPLNAAKFGVLYRF